MIMGRAHGSLPSASDFLAVSVGLVLALDQQDLKGENFPPKALKPARFKKGEFSPKSSGTSRI